MARRASRGSWAAVCLGSGSALFSGGEQGIHYQWLKPDRRHNFGRTPMSRNGGETWGTPFFTSFTSINRNAWLMSAYISGKKSPDSRELFFNLTTLGRICKNHALGLASIANRKGPRRT